MTSFDCDHVYVSLTVPCCYPENCFIEVFQLYLVDQNLKTKHNNAKTIYNLLFYLFFFLKGANMRQLFKQCLDTIYNIIYLFTELLF